MVTKVKERPIIFSIESVKAILDDRKTQTRRIVKGIALDWLEPDMFTPEFVADPENNLCPYGQAGDRLWVRETWATNKEADNEKPNSPYLYYGAACYYKAENPPEHGKWRPAIYMPKWLCRIRLEITEVKVERLQEIRLMDIFAEGIDSGRTTTEGIKDTFADLWDSLNAKRGYGWEVNPWVWVISFRRL